MFGTPALPPPLGQVKSTPMSRVINPNAPGKSRNYHMRTLAEMLRRLARKGEVDAETKDMLAAAVLILREIDAGVNISAEAWERRDYWLKADRFRIEWEWAKQAATDMEDVIRNEAWDLLPRLMMDLFPHFADIKIKRLTRKPDLWEGVYQQLMTEG